MSEQKISASIVGASGYAGGELLRILLDHPNVEIGQVTAETHRTKFVHTLHPNLRGRASMKFVGVDELEPCDVLFLALPHGAAMERIEEFMGKARKVIDLSADFRLRNPDGYPRWYGAEHTKPAMLDKFIYGMPEISREALRTADYATGAGCNATATILGLWPLVKSGAVEIDRVIADIKNGSSEGGAKHSAASHHPERAGCVRSYAPTGHRHTAEVLQAMGWDDATKVQMSATSLGMVRGVLGTLHVLTKKPVDDKALWKIFRSTYRDEPFIRIVKDKQGLYRLPEPKILAGSNYCDVGFIADPDNHRIVVITAIDNQMKGAAGAAAQSMNIMMGFEETAGLTFPGLHPC